MCIKKKKNCFPSALVKRRTTKYLHELLCDEYYLKNQSWIQTVVKPRSNVNRQEVQKPFCIHVQRCLLKVSTERRCESVCVCVWLLYETKNLYFHLNFGEQE